MKIILCLLFVFIGANGSPVESKKPKATFVDPKFLKERSTEGRTELSRHEAMHHKDLKYGDIMPVMEVSDEEGRNVIRFERNSGLKWTNRVVPYVISSTFNNRERNEIEKGINRWNELLAGCIELVRRDGQRDYVEVISGDGCWSHLGKTGRKQQLSLQRNGCLDQGTIIHEFMHAIGFDHEQCRPDRDNTIEILWNNIAKEWHSQYERNDPEEFIGKFSYDPYSVMHYPIMAPDEYTKRAIRFKNSVDEDRVGNANDFTDLDLRKIREEYCKR